MNNRVSLAHCCAGIAIASVISTAAYAQEQAYRIRPQDLRSALKEFGLQSGQAIAFTEDSVKGRRSSGVTGLLGKVEALQTILEGTSLSFQRVQGGFAIVPRAVEPKFVKTALQGVSAPSQPAAEATASASLPEQDIVVTAQKRAQSIQDVSKSITAVTGESLRDAGIASVQDLQVAVPNITIGTSFGFSNLFIRGLGLNSAFANVDPSVTLYEDGAVISQPSAQLFSFFDLERVEVLRGPQGTLYGRNSTGGTINLITAKPTDMLSGFSRLEIGNYSMVQAEGAISGPITSTLSGRLAYFFSRRDGFGINQVTGQDISDYDTRAIRGQLRFRPSDRFDFLVSAEYGRENDRANAFLFKRETFPGVLTDSNPANNGLASLGRGGYPTGGPRSYSSTVDPYNHLKTGSVTATARLKLNDALTLTNITNYRRFKADQVQDIDLSAVVNSLVLNFVFDSKQFSEEFQVNLDTDRLNAVAGFYYFTEDLFHSNSVATAAKVGEYDQNTVGNGRRVYLAGNGDTDTWALYWNANYKLTDRLTLRGGGRFTNDRRKIDNENYVWIPATAPCSPGTVVAGPSLGRVQCYNPTLDDKKTFRNYTNEAGVEWRPDRDIMLYYTYSEGFKAGTGQLGTTQTRLPLIIKPETVVNNEIGLKTAFNNKRIIFNISAYAYKVKDVQLDRSFPGGPAGFTTVFENGTSQKAKGIEMDASWRPSAVFRSSASVALQKTRFGSLLTTDPINPGLFNPADPSLPQNIKSNRARNAPGLAASVHLEYDIPINNGGYFTLLGDGSYKGKQYFSEFNDELLSQDGYALFDARVRYTFPRDKWQASLWVKNLTNELAESANFALASARIIGRTFIPPRTYGASLSYRF